MEKGPGTYDLPNFVGKTKFESDKRTSPAFTIGLRIKNNKKILTKDITSVD